MRSLNSGDAKRKKRIKQIEEAMQRLLHKVLSQNTLDPDPPTVFYPLPVPIVIDFTINPNDGEEDDNAGGD